MRAALCLFTAFFLSLPLQSQSLFSQDEPLVLELHCALQKLKKKASEGEEDYQPAWLRIEQGGKEVFADSLRIRPRGNSRLEICDFPPLKLKFPKTYRDSSALGPLDKVKLVSHCRSKTKYEQPLLQEYLVYKAYQLFTDLSLQVRLVRIRYLDSQSDELDTEVHWGFLLEEEEEMAKRRRLRESLRGRDMLIGVDRLDYSKGLLQRFRAFGTLLENYPANRGRVVMMQIAPPSRQDVPEYLQLRQQLESEAGHVNGAYAEFDWNPIRYLNKGFSRRILAGFLRQGRVGVVTPLRDGMNLVAKEYVAAQNPDDPGVLMLSRFAGAALELDGALLVNPYDAEGMAEAMQTALAMPLEERRERWQSMFRRLETHDVDAWCKQVVGQLDRIGRD